MMFRKESRLHPLSPAAAGAHTCNRRPSPAHIHNHETNNSLAAAVLILFAILLINGFSVPAAKASEAKHDLVNVVIDDQPIRGSKYRTDFTAMLKRQFGEIFKNVDVKTNYSGGTAADLVVVIKSVDVIFEVTKIESAKDEKNKKVALLDMGGDNNVLYPSVTVKSRIQTRTGKYDDVNTYENKSVYKLGLADLVIVPLAGTALLGTAGDGEAVVNPVVKATRESIVQDTAMDMLAKEIATKTAASPNYVAFLDSLETARNQSGDHNLAVRVLNIFKGINSGSTEYKRGLPPNLMAEIGFKDQSDSGTLKAGESAELTLTITNKGKGKAQGVTVTVEDSRPDPAMEIGSGEISVIEPGETKTVSIRLRAKADLQSAEHKLKIVVAEYFGFDIDPVYLTINTVEYAPAKLVFSGMEIVDSGSGTAAIAEDGLLQAGETVKVRVAVRNTGEGTAEGASFSVASKDQNIYLDNNTGKLGNIASGEARDFWITVTPNKRVSTKTELPIYLTVREKSGKGDIEQFQLPIRLNAKPQKLQSVAIAPQPKSRARKKASPYLVSKSSRFSASKGSNITEAARPGREDQFLNTEKEQQDSGVKKWAVVVGISKYKDTKIAGLRYAAADARAFHNWLTSSQGGGYAPANVKLLLDNKATSENIKAALYNWLKQAAEDDMVTIYFAGHGSPESPDTPNNLYLLSHDTKYNNIAATGFPMWDVKTAISRFIKAKKIVVIADACHAGGLGSAFDTGRRGIRNVEINPISAGFQSLSNAGDGVAVISASDDKQLSQESKNWGGGHGVFTYYLVKGLSGDADYNKDGHVTLGELIPYLSEHVRKATKNAQSPTVAGRFDPFMAITNQAPSK